MTDMKLISCDIDGTLIPVRTAALGHDIPPMIRNLNKKGIRFSVNTGRQYGFVRPMFRDLLDEVYIICQNGATIYFQDKLIASHPIPRTLAYEISDDMDTLSGTEHIASTAQHYYYLGQAPQDRMMQRIYKMEQMVQLKSIREIPPTEEIMQLTLYDFDSVIKRKPQLDLLLAGRINANIGSDLCIDITAGDKGTGICNLCRILGISPENVMAFGDNQNDIPMLQAVGIPYVMETAPEKMKQQFGHTCKNVTDILEKL